jgi:type I restriction enzyme M protein
MAAWASSCRTEYCFRSGEEGKIREGLLFGTNAASGNQPGDLIEAIIGLPSALFYNTGIPACVLVLNKRPLRSGQAHHQ